MNETLDCSGPWNFDVRDDQDGGLDITNGSPSRKPRKVARKAKKAPRRAGKKAKKSVDKVSKKATKASPKTMRKKKSRSGR
jgi:hypothetical protein